MGTGHRSSARQRSCVLEMNDGTSTAVGGWGWPAFNISEPALDVLMPWYDVRGPGHSVGGGLSRAVAAT
jgi:hypothetical protein